MGADGSVFGLPDRPTHRAFPAPHRRQWHVGLPQVEVSNPERLSSPVTAARQRRIFTGLPGTHPQPLSPTTGVVATNYSRFVPTMQ